MNIFRWAALPLVFGISLFAKSPNRPCPPPSPPVEEVRSSPDAALPPSFPAAYNASAKIDNNKTHFYGDVSFLYWFTSQEYMDIGRSALFTPTQSTPASNAAVAIEDFAYEPGFQLGLGYISDYDDWQIELNYTYLHFDRSSQFGSVPNSIASGAPVWIPNEWFLNLSSSSVQQQAVQLNSKWKFRLDDLDFLLSRPFYQGRLLILSPYTGIKALWIRQNYTIHATLATSLRGTPAVSHNRSKCWSLGPTFGTESKWLLGRGFRAEADISYSLLYFSYSDLQHTESFNTVITETAPISGRAPDDSAIRPIAAASLGLGWGSYLQDRNYHIDFAASYDFRVLFQQNKPRETVGYLANNEVGYSNPIGDLYLHGLTLKGRFDF